MKGELIKYRIVCFIILLLCGCYVSGVAQTAVFEMKGAPTDDLTLTDYVEVFEDSSHALTLDAVTSPEFEHRFHKNFIEQRPNYNSQHGVAWGRFKIHNNSNAHFECLIYGNWSAATLYRKLADGTYSSDYSGFSVPMSVKKFKSASSSYLVEFAPQEVIQFYFRYENQNFKTFNPIHIVGLRSPASYYNLRERGFMLFMGFAGLELMMMVYALALFFVFRNTNYLWLCTALAANIMYFMQNGGMAAYVFTTNPLFNIFAVYGLSAMYIPVMLVAQFQFLNSFLEIKEHFKTLQRIIAGLIYAVAICTPVCLLLERASLGITLTNYGAIIGSVMIIYVITRIALKGQPLAKLMLYSQGTLAVFVVVATIMNLGFLRDLPVTANSLLMTGYLSQSLFWTFAVIYKLVLLRKEKDKAQGDVISALQMNDKLIREQNVTLESKVEERTIELVEKNNIITAEKERSDALLLNILPEEVAEELKETGSSPAKLFDDVTVLFTDFKEFALLSEQLSPQDLVDELHSCFKVFDEITDRYEIEKIKTIGDAYLAVCGLPVPDPAHATKVVNAAIEIRDFMVERKRLLGDRTFEIRIGVNSGSVVAGIVGLKKFAYDIWGDTVNTAARMEQNCQPGKINVSESTYNLVNKQFACEYRGEVIAKNKGKLKMYFVEAMSVRNQV